MEAKELLNVAQLKMYFPLKGGIFREGRRYVKAVDGVSFAVPEGQTFGLVGESGCGKTTVGKCILRVHRPTSGSIVYKGVDLAGLSERELRPIRRQIQLVFQDPYGSLDPRQSAASILKEAILADGVRRSAGEVSDRIGELFTLVELPGEIGGRYPHEMSGGQRQRLGIARALACDPKLMICDEPVSALDVSIQAQIINLFKSLQRQLGLTYVFIAHDLAVVKHIADTVAVMYLGNIVEIMSAEELYSNPVHPYTKALLSAVPITDYYAEQKRERILLQGDVTSPINAPSGCPFHPRCPYAMDVCKACKPTLESYCSGHQVACYLVNATEGLK